MVILISFFVLMRLKSRDLNKMLLKLVVDLRSSRAKTIVSLLLLIEPSTRSSDVAANTFRLGGIMRMSLKELLGKLSSSNEDKLRSAEQRLLTCRFRDLR